MCSSTLPDPLADPAAQQLLADFFALLGERRFQACQERLRRFDETAPTPAKEQILLYCAAILRNEENRWDQGETVLLALLRQPLHPNLSMRAWNALGIAVEHLGRLDEAAEAYERALELAQRSGDSLYWARVAKNRAICTIRAVEAGVVPPERLLACRTDLEQTIGIFHSADERLLEGRSWNELGATFKATGDWAQALECYAKDRAICAALEDRHGLAASLNNSGEALNALGRYAEAESLLAQAAAGFAASDDAFEQADALTNWGNALAGLGRAEAARRAYAGAIGCVEDVRRSIHSYTARMDFFATQTRIYGARIAHALRLGQTEAAFHVAERARSRGMLELLGGQVQDATPLTAQEALSLLPADTGLLAWFALEKQLVGFALSPSRGVRAVRLPIAPTELINGSFDSRGAPRSLTPDLAGRLTSPWLLAHLHDRLVAPLLAELPPCEQLVLVPHGPLHWLPLHAAFNRTTGRHLCDDYDLLYAPSATIQLAQLQSRQMDSGRSGVLALACADHSLRHVQAEVHDVARISQGLALSGQAASLATLAQESQNFRWLHLAGHAHYVAHAPLASGVDLADGRLTAQQLLQGPDLGFALAWVNG
ncbi:MAG: CHAT domain-containing protein, partial [Chloroflexi bacterium]|nr:CHAT domain-containing protein [Chloroflexota bacterium]